MFLNPEDAVRRLIAGERLKTQFGHIVYWDGKAFFVESKDETFCSSYQASFDKLFSIELWTTEEIAEWSKSEDAENYLVASEENASAGFQSPDFWDYVCDPSYYTRIKIVSKAEKFYKD